MLVTPDKETADVNVRIGVVCLLGAIVGVRVGIADGFRVGANVTLAEGATVG